DRHVTVERHVLGEVADPTADLQRLLEHVVTRDPGCPARRRHEAGEDPHGRRLAGAVRTQEADDLSLLDREGHVLDGRDRPVALGEAINLNHGSSLRSCGRGRPAIHREIRALGPTPWRATGSRDPRVEYITASWDAQTSPVIRPSASTSIRSALGTRGSPGIVRMSPVIGTRKPAPAEMRTSPTVTVKSRGRPRSAGSSESERCVLAMQMGSPS